MSVTKFMTKTKREAKNINAELSLALEVRLVFVKYNRADFWSSPMLLFSRALIKS